LHVDDTVFLNTFALVLFWFRSGVFPHRLVLLLRNFSFAVVPDVVQPVDDLIALIRKIFQEKF